MTTEKRRILTILFSDVVGSSALAERLDPEDWREIVEQVHELSGDIVLAHHGRVLQYLGDGLLAVFGADQSSERDPERAIHAALDIIAQIPDLPTQPRVEMRAGIHTGLVVIGELGGKARQELTASGAAMNLTQRLQMLAAPSRVVISHECYRYVRGLFNITKQDPITVKGWQAPVQPYLVEGLKERPFRMVARGVGGVKTTTVGRKREGEQIQQQLQNVLQEEALIWSQIIAGPGLGKTRMLGDIVEALDQIDQELYILRTQALEGDSLHPYAAIRRLWFDQFELTKDTPVREVEMRWEKRVLQLLGQDLQTEALALGLLIGLLFEGHPSIDLLRGQPAMIKPLAYKASKIILEEVRDKRPIIFLLEDLQWADHATWEYLTNVFLGTPSAENGLKSTLLLATARSGWLPPESLLQHKAYQQLTLAPLTRADSTLLLSQLLQYSDPLPDPLIDHIMRRCEGVPYYLEEMVNWLIDMKVLDISKDPWALQAENLIEELLPQTLHHLLSTRINNLDNKHQRILQAAAIFGRHFWEGGLTALGVEAQVYELEGLQQQGFIQHSDSSSFIEETEWYFHHKLMQVVAYESVLKRERPQHHLAAAHWLENRAGAAGRQAEFAGHLGQHFEKAGHGLQALTWYLQHDEVQSNLGLIDQRGPQLDHLILLAEELGDDQKLAEVYYHQGAYLHGLGAYAQSLESLEKALVALGGQEDSGLEGLILAHIITDQSRLGDFEAAHISAERALDILEQIEDECTIARMLTNISMVYAEGGDIGRAAALYERPLEINHRTGEIYGEAVGYSNYGYLLLQLGLFREGLKALERASSLFHKIRARRMQAYVALNLGLANFRVGNPEKGREIIDEQACDEFEATGDRFGIGIAGCYLGLCHEAKGDPVAARAAFNDAHRTLTEIGVPGQAMDALAGSARCQLELGETEQASQTNEELWAFLREEGAEGLEFPLLAYQTCVRVFEATEKNKQAQRARKEGYDELMRRAERISDDRWRRSFLDNIPEHQLIACKMQKFI